MLRCLANRQLPPTISQSLNKSNLSLDAAGSTYGGAVSVDGATGSAKSTISVINTADGFASASDLVLPGFGVEYEMYKQRALGTASTPAFRIGIQSTNWATNSSYTATRSGESAWDLILVHVPTILEVENNTWKTISLDATNGTWFLYDQFGNTFYTPPGGAANSDKTIAGWLADLTWGPVLFGPGAKVSVFNLAWEAINLVQLDISITFKRACSMVAM